MAVNSTFTNQAFQRAAPATLKVWQMGLCGSFLALHGGLLAWAAFVHSVTIDEPHHLLGGLTQLCRGSSTADPGNPPLFGIVAALPVLISTGGSIRFSDFHGPQLQTLVTTGRLALIPFSLLGGLVCGRWALELYGPSAGIAATALWCFCPSTLASGHLIVGDMAAASCGAAAYYAFWKFLERPAAESAFVAGSALGIAEVSKYVWVVNFVVWPLILCAWHWFARQRQSAATIRWPHLLVGATSAIAVIHLCYGFGDFIPANGTRPFAAVNSGEVQPEISPIGSALGLLPRDYVAGIFEIRSFVHKTQSDSSFLLGAWRSGGFPYFYLVALAIKLPLGLLLLFGWRVVQMVRIPSTRTLAPELLMVTAIASVLAIVSAATGSQQMVRYALPVLPFMIIMGSGATAQLAGTGTVAGVLFTFWSCMAGIFDFPHNAPYCNELVGGPAQASKYLTGSDIDSGQNLFFIGRWQRAHPEAHPLYLSYPTPASPSWAGITWESLPPVNPVDGVVTVSPGWYAISANQLHHATLYSHFRDLVPNFRIGYSVNIYHVRSSIHLTVLPSGKLTAGNTSINSMPPADGRQTPQRDRL